ncbi:hypothetical protein, partial [Streptomyces sp. NPDC058953]|uniref:hypothetical protein n=1 Tax=Streptomyces sp. NPDC058953 TaxID=3346676 RepID=UPI0036C4424C
MVPPPGFHPGWWGWGGAAHPPGQGARLAALAERDRRVLIRAPGERAIRSDTIRSDDELRARARALLAARRSRTVTGAATSPGGGR